MPRIDTSRGGPVTRTAPKSARFYRQFCSRPGADTRLVLFTPDGHEDRVGTDQNVVFWTDDVEKTAKELAAKGVTFTSQPKKEPWGTFAIFQDPDGNRFVLGTK